MIRVTAPSRLHFGLMNAGNLRGVPRFGGLGLMIEHPAIMVNVELAAEWDVSGPHPVRALDAARNVTALCGFRDAFRVVVEECPASHIGLGVGTQLALASGKAASQALRVTVSPAALAKVLGRGKRSAIGVEGFHTGGFIIDRGKSRGQILAETQRFDWPSEWTILLARPRTASTWHGRSELGAFARPRDMKRSIRTAERMRHLAVDVIAPALERRDLSAFGRSLHEYNRSAGEAFAEDQGGVYSSPEVDALVAWIRNRGIAGVGQSSWGPTVFAICRDANEAGGLASELRTAFPHLEDVRVTNGANRGHAISS